MTRLTHIRIFFQRPRSPRIAVMMCLKYVITASVLSVACAGRLPTDEEGQDLNPVRTEVAASIQDGNEAANQEQKVHLVRTHSLQVDVFGFEQRLGKVMVLRVIDNDRDAEIVYAQVGPLDHETFVFYIKNILLQGHTYTIHVFLDNNDNGNYDSGDSAWSFRSGEVTSLVSKRIEGPEGSATVDFPNKQRHTLTFNGIHFSGSYGNAATLTLKDTLGYKVFAQDLQRTEAGQFSIEMPHVLVEGHQYTLSFVVDVAAPPSGGPIVRFKKTKTVTTDRVSDAVVVDFDGGAFSEVDVKIVEEFQSDAPQGKSSYFNKIDKLLQRQGCQSCHNSYGSTPFALVGHKEQDYQTVTGLLNVENPQKSLFLTKASGGVAHYGGRIMPVASTAYKDVLQWVVDGAYR